MAAASPLQAAQDDQSDTALLADCKSLKSLSLPDADARPASMAASLKGCSLSAPGNAPISNGKIQTMAGPISSPGRAY